MATSFLKKARVRRLLTVVGVIGAFFIFAVGSYAAILLVQGRIIDDGGKLVQTGIIRLNVIPEGVNVYINGTLKSLNNRLIEYIEPGEVLLSIEKEGFTPWEKTIKIESGVIKDVFAQLFPDELDFTKVIEGDVDKLFFSDNGEYVFYTLLNGKESENGIWKFKLTRNIFDIGENRPIQIASFDANQIASLKQNYYDIMLSQDSSRFLLLIPAESIVQIYNSDVLNGIIDVYRDLDGYPDDISWFRNTASLILRYDELVYEYELSSNQKTIISTNITETTPYFVGGDFMYYTRLGKVVKYKNKASTALREADADIILPTNIERIISDKFNENILILQDESSLLYLDFDKEFFDKVENVEDIVNVSRNVRGVIFSNSEDYFSYALEPSRNNQTLISTISELNIGDSNVLRIYYSSNNGNIILFTKEGENKVIEVMDFDGFNRKVLYNDKFLTEKEFYLKSDNSVMYLVLDENFEGTRINSLYQLDLLDTL